MTWLLQVISDQNPVSVSYIRDYTTQLYRGSKKNIIKISINQPGTMEGNLKVLFPLLKWANSLSKVGTWRIIPGLVSVVRIAPNLKAIYIGHLEGVPQPDPTTGTTTTLQETNISPLQKVTFEDDGFIDIFLSNGGMPWHRCFPGWYPWASILSVDWFGIRSLVVNFNQTSAV